MLLITAMLALLIVAYLGCFWLVHFSSRLIGPPQ